jgi:hypothetical protein
LVAGAPALGMTKSTEMAVMAMTLKDRSGDSRELLLSVVGVGGVGERMVAWVGETAWTMLGTNGQDFVWGRFSLDDSALGDPASFDLALPYRRGRCSAAGDWHPGGVAA